MDFLLFLFFITVFSGLLYIYKKFHYKGEFDHETISLKSFISIFSSLFPIFLAVFFIRSFLFEPFQIPSGSMKPTLLEGDFIMVKKFSYRVNLPIINFPMFEIQNPTNGDIIVFKHNKNTNMIKRIIAIPGEKIFYNKKFIYINYKIQKQYDLGATVDKNNNKLNLYVRCKKENIKNIEHKIYHIIGLQNRKYEFNNIKIPQNKYFVMGDFRDNSQDSRVWGLVDKSKIIGKAIFIWMSWNKNNNDIRWERIGKKIV